MDDFMSASEAAGYLKITKRAVTKLCQEGKLTARLVGPMWIVERRSVEKYARSPRKPGRPAKEK
jgi:excisionase family DNA binding protein